MSTNIIKNIKESQYLKPLTTVIMITNIILGTGPIIIPPVFLLGGIGLSSIFILIIAFLSYIACEFIVESISICNALVALKKESATLQLVSTNADLISESERSEEKEKKNNVTMVKIQEISVKSEKKLQVNTVSQISTMPTNNCLSTENLENGLQIPEEQSDEEQNSYQLSAQSNSSENSSNSNKSDNKQIKPKQIESKQDNVVITVKDNVKNDTPSQDSIFSIKQNFEFQEMGQMIYGKTGKHIAATLICIYLFGVIISKYIITAQTMAGVFEGTQYLGTYSFWLGLFFILCAIQSFKNMSDIKWVQNLIGFVRLVTIILFIGAPLYIIFSTGKSYPITNFSHTYENNQTFEYKAFNFEAFSNLFSNLIFSFLFHHSLGSIISNNKPEKSIKKVIGIVYVISVAASLAIPIIAIKAFGGQLTNPFDTDSIVYYNNMFKESLQWVYYFTSFYIFLNVASLPVVTIVLKNNLLKWILPLKQNEKKYNIGCTSLVLFIILLCAILFQNQIQTVISVIAGLCGVLIMMLLPSIFVIKGRQLISQKIQENKQLQQQDVEQKQQQQNKNNQNNIHKSIIGFKCLPYLLTGLAVVIFSYNSYLMLNKFLN